MTFFLILFVVVALIGGGLLLYANKKSTVETKESDLNKSERIISIKNALPVEKIYNGIIEHYGQYLLMALIEGMNFSVMSDIEQNARENSLVEILSRMDYPVRFITNTCVVDTSQEARKIASIADDSGNEFMKEYRIFYAGALEQMRLERSVLTQQTYIIVPGSTEKEVHERFNLLCSSLRERTSMIITPLETTEQVYDALQDILTPDKIIKPSDVVQDGVLEVIHFSTKEVQQIAQKIANG
jgi:hypothetical protein